MNKRKRHIVFAWFVLAAFVAGQSALLSHHHELIVCCSKDNERSDVSGFHKQLKKDCLLCDPAVSKLFALTCSPEFLLVAYCIFAYAALVVLIDIRQKFHVRLRGPPVSNRHIAFLYSQITFKFKKT